MQRFEADILISVPVQYCFQQWVTSDFYPRLNFKGCPTLPQKWSSADAWGENSISGIQHVDWSLASYPGQEPVQINWHIQNRLKGQLLEYCGIVTFEPQESGQATRIQLGLFRNDDNDSIDSQWVRQLLYECLEKFHISVQLLARDPDIYRFKMVV